MTAKARQITVVVVAVGSLACGFPFMFALVGELSLCCIADGLIVYYSLNSEWDNRLAAAAWGASTALIVGAAMLACSPALGHSMSFWGLTTIIVFVVAAPVIALRIARRER